MPDTLRYPIGPFAYDGPLTPEKRQRALDDIAELPRRLRRAVEGLDDTQLDTPYRDGGWTVRQTVHHLADSHINAYTRFRLALTEDAPTIKPYDEAAWADLKDACDMPIDVSLTLLDALHARWTYLLRHLAPEAFARTFTHPAHGKTFDLDWMLALYAWHGKHHTAHITKLAEREGWV